MPAPNTIGQRRLPDTVRRRLEVATAMSWEALVDAHTRQALQFVTLLADRMEFAETLDRYVREMRVPDPMERSVRTRVLVALEDTDEASSVHGPLADMDPDPAGDEGWTRFAPGFLFRGKERRRKDEETEGWIKLALARAEEGTILAHVDNALAFAALLGPYLPLDRAVMEYIDAMELVGGRAQVVFQRTMARLADVHLPALDRDGRAPLGD